MLKYMFVIVFIISVITCNAVTADDFLIGCYSYLKALPSTFTLNDSLISYMQQAGYNQTIWDTNENGVSNTDHWRQQLESVGISSFLCDYLWRDNTTGSDLVGTHAASTGNYWRFDAEYCTEGGSNQNIDRYFYKFNEDSRVGSSQPDGNRTIWRCVSDTLGIAISGLKYRWNNYYPGTDGTQIQGVEGVENCFGPELRFPSWGDQTVNGDTLSILYLQNNKVYIKICYKIQTPSTGNEFAVKLGCGFKKNDGTWSYVPIKNALTSDSPAEFIYYSRSDLESDLLTSHEDPNEPDNPYRVVILEIDPVWLCNNGYLNSNPYWFSTLYGIEPYVQWLGASVNTMYFDYIEVYDTMYQTLEYNPTSIDLRSFSNVMRHYTLDEPSQPQFKAFQRLNDLLPGSETAISTVNNHGNGMKKPNGTRFSMQNLFLDQTTPTELMIDCYPLVPNHNWNLPAFYGTTPNTNSVQFDLDWKTLNHYRKYRKETLNQPNPQKLIVVPPTFGFWNPGRVKWEIYQYPTPQMAKCLQLLPLCFGVDGIINYNFYNSMTPATTQFINVPPPFEPDVFPIESDRSGYQHYSLLDVYYRDTNDYDIITSSVYQAICEANSKIGIYSEIIKNPANPLSWQDSATIGFDGLFLTPKAYDEEDISDTHWNQYLSSLRSYTIPGYPYGSYFGYVQCGFYQDGNNLPSYMLVNRRTNFSGAQDGTMQNLNVDYLRNGIGYSIAGPQQVCFDLNPAAYNELGSYIALYDPYDETIFHPESTVDHMIYVPVDPGDGRLLEMVGSLPDEVITQTTLRGKVVISGQINVRNSVNIEAGSIVDIKSGSYFQVSSPFVLRGTVVIGENVTFDIRDQGYVSFENANCTWGNGSYIKCLDDGRSFGFLNSSAVMGSNAMIEINSGECIVTNSDLKLGSNCTIRISNADLFVSGSSLDSFGEGITWSGLDANNSSRINMSNSTIKNMICNKVSNSDLVMENCRVEVPLGGTGLSLCGDIQGFTTSIICSSETSGFYSSKDNSYGIEIALMSNPIVVQGAKFVGLTKGIFKVASSASQDEISYCSFENCSIGIHCISPEYHGIVRNCGFHQSNPLNEYTGIKLQGSAPIITDCQFTNLDLGIDTEYSLQTYSRGVKYSNFVRPLRNTKESSFPGSTL